jgi:lambda repressor-like predicted transcriptional regulator
MATTTASEKKRLIAQIKRRRPSLADLARRGLLNRTLAPPTGRFDEARRTLKKAGLDIEKLVEKTGLDINKLREIAKRERRTQREQDRIQKNKRQPPRRLSLQSRTHFVMALRNGSRH